MANKYPFTPATIDAFQRGSLADPLTPGLAIEVLASGKKRWRYRRRCARKMGTVVTMFGGTYPAQNIADARG